MLIIVIFGIFRLFFLTFILPKTQFRISQLPALKFRQTLKVQSDMKFPKKYLFFVASNTYQDLSIDDTAIARLEKMRGYLDGNGVPLTRTPATVEEFRAIIAKLQNEIAGLNARVEQLESKQGSWFDRVFKG